MNKLDYENRFEFLVKKWKEDTMFISSSTQIENHESYKEIIKMGPKVLGLIIKELEVSNGWWFNALKEITGYNLLDDSCAGNYEKSREIWLNWYAKFVD